METISLPMTTAESPEINFEAAPSPGATLQDNDAPEKEESQVEDESKPAVKTPTRCGVCKEQIAKYKCARCPLAYCSVACSKSHRENHPPDAAPAPPKPAPQQSLPLRSISHPFSVLDDAPELRWLFAKHPTLRKKLASIYDATLPPKDPANVRSGLPFNLAAAKARGGGNQKNQPWTKETGLRKGQQALRAARVDPSEAGDGVREYCEVVLYLLSRSAEEDVTASVRQEVSAGDAKLIQEMLQTDGRP